ncbi:MAG TPA: hypothetical protein VEH06_11000 [Candidatus Bathyarchaeia archaeon]|nr:hypothetical protein [Candidatus Bathyarchaeia archaeon]
MNRSDGNNCNYDRVVVATGSSRRIGKSIAEEFVQNGYCVVVNSRDEEDLNRVSLKILPGKSETLKEFITLQAMCVS